MGSARRPDAPARRDHGGHRQLLAVAHAGARARSRRARATCSASSRTSPSTRSPSGIPWTWESYAEWRDALRAHGTAVNIAALVGHSNLRVYVMGDDAWTRAATPDERAQLAAVLAESLAAGALGMSTSFVDQDRHGHAVPSRAADDDELRALIEVLGARTRASLGCSSSCPGSRRPSGNSSTSTAWRAGAARPACRAPGTSWPRTAATRRAPSASSSRPTRCTPTAVACTRRCRRVRSTCTSASTRRRRSWRSRRGASSSQRPPDEKRRMLADDEWRARARADWDRVGDGFTIFPVSRLDRVRLTSVRAGEEQFLGAIARRRRRRARRSPVRRARRLGARARPRAGHGRRGAVEQRRGQGVRSSSPTRPRWSAPATPARTSR